MPKKPSGDTYFTIEKPTSHTSNIPTFTLLVICFLFLSLQTRKSRHKWQYTPVYLEMEWRKLVNCSVPHVPHQAKWGSGENWWTVACLMCLTRPNEAGLTRSSVRQWFRRPCHVWMANCTWHYAKPRTIDETANNHAEHIHRQIINCTTCAAFIYGVDSRYWSVAKLR